MEYLNGNTDNITLWKVDNRIPTRSRIGVKKKTKPRYESRKMVSKLGLSRLKIRLRNSSRNILG